MDNSTIFQNEFAMVEVRRDETANGVRLLIRDMASGDRVFLDPLELEGLARASHGLFRSLIAPKAPNRAGVDTPIDDITLP